MNDLRFGLELKKFKEEEKFCNMTNNQNYSIDLFRYRHELKAIILNLNSKLPKRDVENFRKKYYHCLETRRIKYPNYIFDEFNEEKFSKCLILQKKGYTLGQIEDEYSKFYEQEVKCDNFVKIR